MIQESVLLRTLQPQFSEDIRPVTPSESEKALAVILLAFSTDPVARWVYPEPADYLQYFPAFIRAFGGSSVRHGTALLSNDLAGAALWLPPGAGPDEDAIAELTERTVDRSIREDLALVFEAMAEYHPDEPHWYLPMIGVETQQQGKGIGVRLMEYALDRSDRHGVPSYLESSNPRNISLYERCGFVSLGTIQFGGSPPLYPMIRWPR
jgi:ribosomal protein S18 acetylase RimI-like enzyme